MQGGIMRTQIYRLIAVIFLLTSCFLTASTSQQPNLDATNEVMVVFVEIVDTYCPGIDVLRKPVSLPLALGVMHFTRQWSICTPDFPPDLVSQINSPKMSATSYVNALNFEMTAFLREATFENEIFHFNAISNPNRSDGWFVAPHPLVDYNQSKNASMGRDAFDLAKTVIGDAVYDYDTLLVINNIHSQFGYTTWLSGLPTAVVTGEHADMTSFYEVLGHEFGHVLTLRHVHMGPYDIVGNSDVLVHYGGWSKVYAGWVPQITDMPCIGGQCEITTTLDPLERAGNNVLRIPFANLSGNNFVGYFVECRAKIGYDSNIPKAGVIISKIDTVAEPDMASYIVFPSGDGDYSNAALSPGEVFIDPDQAITILYLSKDGTNRCEVKATRGIIEVPDPRIRAGSEELAFGGYITYGSRDIWIDSQQNGWDAYPPGTDLMLEGGNVVPVGYGDPFWAEHENRIKFLISNVGYSEAENVIVDVYVTQPIMFYIPGVTCDGPELNVATLLSTIEIDQLDKGGVYVGEVPWTPTSNAAAQVTVVIRDYFGEITHSNNTASETYAQQNILVENIVENMAETEVLQLPDFFEAPLVVGVQTNPTCVDEIPFLLRRKVIAALEKKFWVMDEDSLEGLLKPGDTMEIPLASMPPEDAKAGDCQEIELELSAFMDDFFVPITGLTYKTCVQEPTTLTCETPPEPMGLGVTVQTSGILTPASGGEVVAIEYTGPGGSHMIQLVEVGKDGRYDDNFKPEIGGSWVMQSYWQGTQKYASAESPVCVFSVDSTLPEFTLESNAFCRTGPGSVYPVLTGGELGEVMDVIGRSKDLQWIYGTLKGVNCWVYIGLGELNVDPLSIPEWAAPVPSTTPTPSSSVCSMYTTELGCNRRSDICMWVVQPTGGGACVSK
jgi:hypothetical protein